MMNDDQDLPLANENISNLYDKITIFLSELSQLQTFLRHQNDNLIKHKTSDTELEQIEQLNPDLTDRTLSDKVVCILSYLKNDVFMNLTEFENTLKTTRSYQGCKDSLSSNVKATEPVEEHLLKMLESVKTAWYELESSLENEI